MKPPDLDLRGMVTTLAEVQEVGTVETEILALETAQQPPRREVTALLTRVKKEIHGAPNRVRYSMNNFVISVGSYIPELLDRAVQVAEATRTIA